MTIITATTPLELPPVTRRYVGDLADAVAAYRIRYGSDPKCVYQWRQYWCFEVKV